MPIEYDVHGFVGIRLVDASPADAAMFKRHFGLPQTPLAREPDITIRFVERLSLKSRLRHLGLEDGFTDDAFVVSRLHPRVEMAFDRLGGRCEIICETGLPAVPLLTPILNLTMLGKGLLPMHASAFTYAGHGVAVTGWSRGSKSGSLLAFMAHGAEYIGDDWVYVGSNGRLYGLLGPIVVRDWYLQDLPQYRARVAQAGQARLQVIRLVQWLNQMSARITGQEWLPKIAPRLTRGLQRRQSLVAFPQELFGQEACRLTGSLDKVFFTISHESLEVNVQPIEPREIAKRMVASLQYEQRDLMPYYWKFRFAFPERRNDLLEQSEELQRERLMQVLADRETYLVYHPYPVRIPVLFDTLCQHLRP